MLNDNFSDSDVSELLVKSIPASFKDPDVLAIFLAIREDNNRYQVANRADMQEIRLLYSNMAEKQVGWGRCTSFREQCASENGRKFDDIFHQLSDLKSTAQDYVSCKDGVSTANGDIKNELKSLRESVDKINNVFVIFKFSRCSVGWIWANKRTVSAIFIFITVWFYLMDTIARWSQWTFFPPRIGP